MPSRWRELASIGRIRCKRSCNEWSDASAQWCSDDSWPFLGMRIPSEPLRCACRRDSSYVRTRFDDLHFTTLEHRHMTIPWIVVNILSNRRQEMRWQRRILDKLKGVPWDVTGVSRARVDGGDDDSEHIIHAQHVGDGGIPSDTWTDSKEHVQHWWNSSLVPLADAWRAASVARGDFRQQTLSHSRSCQERIQQEVGRDSLTRDHLSRAQEKEDTTGGWTSCGNFWSNLRLSQCKRTQFHKSCSIIIKCRRCRQSKCSDQDVQIQCCVSNNERWIGIWWMCGPNDTSYTCDRGCCKRNQIQETGSSPVRAMSPEKSSFKRTHWDGNGL